MILPILYQDQDLVCIHKPSGLLVHRSLIDKQAKEFALQMLRDQLGQPVHPVHRLDRSTSGALVFALNKEAARALTTEFSESRVEKNYLAVVRGHVKDSVTIDYPLKEELDKKTDFRARVGKPAQSAVTVITPLGHCELPFAVDRYPTTRYSLVQAVPQTGRKHQIRRHLHHLRHPIIGDVNYGVGKHNRFFESTFQIRRLLLACTEISFQHPLSQKRICIKSPVAPDFYALIEKLGWKGVCDESLF